MLPIDPHEFTSLSLRCAPTVHVKAMQALVRVESSFQQFAIAVVDGPKVQPPKTQQEAIATVERLEREGHNYSVGFTQVNKHNFKKQGLTLKTAFDACANIQAGARILEDCFISAKGTYSQDDQMALSAAYSCYYSGNFLRGFRPDRPGHSSYVERVLRAALGDAGAPGPTAKVKGLGPGWTR